MNLMAVFSWTRLKKVIFAYLMTLCFDHQPSAAEMLTFQDCVDSVALRHTEPHQIHEARIVHGKIMTGFRRATLKTPPESGSGKVFQVPGGLMFGLRATSAVGSGWYGGLGGMALDLCRHISSSPTDYKLIFDIRGDDTKLVAPTFHAVLGAKTGYDLLGAEANELKFGFYRKRVESLRLETSERVRGYPT